MGNRHDWIRTAQGEHCEACGVTREKSEPGDSCPVRNDFGYRSRLKWELRQAARRRRR